MRRLQLLATSALLAPGLAWGQAPDARPLGGQVVAGQASITQTAGQTQVTQTSNRAVIEWRGFDIGANHQVDIRQPSAGSWSLQRVTGPDPSAVAGRLTSNGGVAIVNPAGVVFQGGAQVDVAGLIATTADTTNQAFMAGRMAFDGPARPGARIENRGTITVRDQGLAALVGPAAANSGTIRARLGRVALAGAEAFTVDLAGDGLLSLDITRQVAGGALATNTGTIAAEGGHVLLTAEAASGLLETLVTAGGSVTAASITANAPGAGVLVPAGAVLQAPGGAITVGAAASSRIGAPERLSARTTVERGARLDAAGGQVIVHAAERTAVSGEIAARGGRIEVSSRRALALDGSLDAGATGSVLIDPQELRVVANLSGATEPAEVTAATINATTGALTLSAERTIRVNAGINKASGPLTLETTNATAAAGEGIVLNRNVTVTGDLVLRSAGDITQAGGTRLSAGTLLADSRAGAVRLDAATNVIRALDGGGAAGRFEVASSVNMAVDGAIRAGDMRLATSQRLSLNAPLTATGTMELVGQRGILQAGSGAGITAGTLLLESSGGAIALSGSGNRITELGDVSAPRGLTLRNATALNLAGVLNGAGATVSLTVDAGALTQDPAASRLFADSLLLSVPGGGVLLDGPSNAIANLAGTARDDMVVSTTGALNLGGTLAGARIVLNAFGDITQDTGALVVTPRLEARSAGGSVLFEDPLNRVDALGASGAALRFALATAGPLALEGALAAPAVQLTAGGRIGQGAAGSVATDLLGVNALVGAVALDGGGNAVATLGPSGAADAFTLHSAGALAVAGPLDAGALLTLQADSLSLASRITAPAVTLRARAGGIEQPGGGLATAVLRAEATDGVNLAAAGNAIAAVSGFGGPGFRVATTGALAVDDIGAASVTLAAGGDLTQRGAIGITADLLAASTGGRLDLSAGTNAIRALGATTAPGGLTLATATGLQLTEAIATPSAAFTTGGDLAQLPAATLSAGTLRLSAGGAIQLDSAGNDLPRLLGASAGGGIALATAGALALEGTVRAGERVTLIAQGEITQPGGILDAPSLVARSIGAGVTLDGANRLGSAGGSAAGSWRLASAGTGTLGLTGLVAAPEVALTLAGGLSDAAGGLRADVLVLDAAGLVALGGAGNRVGAVSGRAAGLQLAAGGPLEVTGSLSLTGALVVSADSLLLAAPVSAGSAILAAGAGSIRQAATGAGLTLTGALDARASDAVALTGAGNQLPRLSAGSAGGDFALATRGSLAVSGGLAGETITLRAGGLMTLETASLLAGRAVLLAAPGGIAARGQSSLGGLVAGRSPALVIDTRLSGGLQSLPAGVQADLAGLAPEAQPTQLALFGAAGSGAGGGAAFDIAAGLSPVFLLLDGGPAVGTLAAGRLGVLAQGGSAFITGTLSGQSGAAAGPYAALSGGQGTYTFNACAIGTACGTTPVDPPIVTPPIVTPPVTPTEPPVVVAPAPPAPGVPALPPGPPVRLALWDLEDAEGWARWPSPWPLPDLVE